MVGAELICPPEGWQGILAAQQSTVIVSLFLSTPKSRPGTATKASLHPRNKHRKGYDFSALISSTPELAAFVKQQPRQTIDFADPAAVRCLNQALLNHHYGIRFWQLPEGYLCPPVPGRVDYIHHIADLLAETAGGNIPQGKRIRGLDIGTGANGIYPLLACREYGWRMLGSDIDAQALQAAGLVAASNPAVKGQIEHRLQAKAKDIFAGIIQPDEYYDFTVCNPPFHASAAEASAGSQRKQANLARNKQRRGGAEVTGKAKVQLNFAGQNNELWCPGGEVEFITKMIRQSKDFADQCLWFTSLVSRQENLPALEKQLRKAKVAQLRQVKMAQGQKVSRFLAWSFYTPDEGREWAQHWHN